MTAKHPKHAAPGHSILPVIAERWSPYAFEPRPVERAKLLACLEAARWAASSYNEQPWTFILAERTDAAAFAKALDCLVEGNQAWAKNVGVLLLTVVSRTFVKNGKPNAACEHDVGLAAGNMVLQATALGLQGHQMIGIVAAKVRAAYQVPDGHDPLTAIALGYPAAVVAGTTDPLAQRDLAPRGRKPLTEIVLSTWGRPAL
ncbi:MAG: nitroreductase family protein [Planctomycetaceae bacterium]|nr:nitroreductase family protein [Planctomycetaceae bacterium]